MKNRFVFSVNLDIWCGSLGWSIPAALTYWVLFPFAAGAITVELQSSSREDVNADRRFPLNLIKCVLVGVGYLCFCLAKFFQRDTPPTAVAHNWQWTPVHQQYAHGHSSAAEETPIETRQTVSSGSRNGHCLVHN